LTSPGKNTIVVIDSAYPQGVYNEVISMKDEKELEELTTCPHCSDRHKNRSPEEQKALLTRLRRIEGQIRGVEKMVEDNRYCPDILTQVSAITSALGSFNKVLLSCHIRSCVIEDIQAGREESIDELCQLLQKLMK